MTETRSQPPLSDELLDEFADKWVIIHSGQVVKAADSYDELVEGRELAEGDILAHIPPSLTVFY